MLMYTPPDLKSNTGGIAIGSSVKDLDDFCGKAVDVRAVGRLLPGKPLCTEQLQKNNSSFCEGKIPVVDIYEISEK